MEDEEKRNLAVRCKAYRKEVEALKNQVAELQVVRKELFMDSRRREHIHQLYIDIRVHILGKKAEKKYALYDYAFGRGLFPRKNLELARKLMAFGTEMGFDDE